MSFHFPYWSSTVPHLLNSAFYDPNTASGDAGNFVAVNALKNACPGKRIFITETGWPSRGGGQNRANASPDDQRRALNSINCAARSDPGVSIYAFEADDSLWKNDNEFERSFGIFGKVDLGASVFNTC